MSPVFVRVGRQGFDSIRSDSLSLARLSVPLPECKKCLEVIYEPNYPLCKVINLREHVIIFLGVSREKPQKYWPLLKPLLYDKDYDYDGLDGSSFIIVSKYSGHVWILRDPFGLHSFYHTIESGNLCISTSLGHLLRDTQSEPIISKEYCTDFLIWPYTSDVDSTLSPYLGIYKVPKGSLTRLTGEQFDNHLLSLRRPASIEYTRLEDYHEHLAELGRNVIRDYVSLAPAQVGIMLSGGLDSTIVTGVAKDILTKEFGTTPATISFTYASFEASDESKWIKIARDYFNLPRTIIMDNSDFHFFSKGALAYPSHSEPHITASSYESYLREANVCRRLGVKLLLTGHGGDAFGTNLGFARDLWREGRLHEFWQCCRLYSSTFHKSPVQVVSKLKESKKPSNSAFLSRVICQHQLDSIMTRQADLLRTARRYWSKREGLANLALMVLYQTVTPFVHSMYYVPEGLMFLSPLRDLRLLLFYAALPTDVAFKLTIQRTGLREAFGNYIPPEIKNRTTKRGLGQQYFMGLPSFRHVLNVMKPEVKTYLSCLQIEALLDLIDDALVGTEPNHVIWSMPRVQALVYWLLSMNTKS